MDRLSLPASDDSVGGDVIRSEPPGTDPYAGWCGGRELTTPGYPIRLFLGNDNGWARVALFRDGHLAFYACGDGPSALHRRRERPLLRSIFNELNEPTVAREQYLNHRHASICAQNRKYPRLSNDPRANERGRIGNRELRCHYRRNVEFDDIYRALRYVIENIRVVE